MLGKNFLLYRICILSGLALSLFYKPVAASAEDDRAALLGILDQMFQAMIDRDSEAIMALSHDNAQIASLSWDDEGNSRLRFAPENGVPPSEDIWTERYWDADVMIEGHIAMVWMPYDFYVNDRFNHCGINVINFLRADETWKIANITYTMVKDGSCDTHPDGPPVLD